MSEKKLWQTMNRGMDDILLKRVDAHMVPDVFFCFKDGGAGWIELKDVDEWPKRETTKTNFGLRSDQAIWLHKVSDFGGRGYIFVRCGSDFMLFVGRDALVVNQGLNRKEALGLCALHCEKQMDWDKLGRLI